jgi:hypothetical protein
MLESLEGKRGMVRPKPPLPAIAGLWGKPTVVNNVMTLAAVPWILAARRRRLRALRRRPQQGHAAVPARRQRQARWPRRGAVRHHAARAALRLRRRHGERVDRSAPCRSAARSAPTCRRASSTRRSTTSVRAGRRHGRPRRHRRVRRHGRHGAMARYAMEFCAIESCGKCTPCRIGSTRGVEVIDRIRTGERREQDLALLRDLCDTMTMPRCARWVGLTPMPVLSALEHFPEDFARPLRSEIDVLQQGLSTTARPSARARRRVSLQIDGVAVTVPSGHVGDARGGRRRRADARSCAPPTASRRSVRAGCASSRSKGARASPPRARRPCEPGMKVKTQSKKLAKLRRG